MSKENDQHGRMETDSKKTVDWLPDPIPARTNALITRVGEHFTIGHTWGTPARVLLFVPPKVPHSRQTKVFSRRDCLAWLETLSRNLAGQLTDPPRQTPYRMLAALEGSPNRGWFYSVILDLPRQCSFHHFKAIIHASMASGPDCYLDNGECNGVIESIHLLGRFGLPYLTVR
jgi:hypothetical protein